MKHQTWGAKWRWVVVEVDDGRGGFEGGGGWLLEQVGDLGKERCNGRLERKIITLSKELFINKWVLFLILFPWKKYDISGDSYNFWKKKKSWFITKSQNILYLNFNTIEGCMWISNIGNSTGKPNSKIIFLYFFN